MTVEFHVHFFFNAEMTKYYRCLTNITLLIEKNYNNNSKNK